MAIWTKSYSPSMQPLATKLFFIGVVALGLSACATTKEDVIPQGGQDMADIYATHQQKAGVTRNPLRQRQGLARPIQPGTADLRAYTQQAANEIEHVFPRLPNPQLVLFVFPHLSTEGAPVPGYATAFPMYAVDQYALPGERYQP